MVDFAERRKTQNWFRRQYSGEMNGDYESNISGEYACAVAAAAYAIKSLEDSVSTDQKRMTEHPETSSIRLKSKKDDGTTMPKPGSESKLFSGEASIKRSEGSESIPISVASDKEMPEKAVGPAPSIKKTPTFADKHLNNSPNSKTTEKTVGPSQPIKKTSTFADNDKPLNRTRSKKPERATSKPDVPPTIQPPFPPTRRQKSSTRPGIGETKADAWERAELAKIEKREHSHFGCNDTREDTIDYIPGVRAIEPTDMMSYLQESDTSSVCHQIIFKAFEEARGADFVLCNTTQDLEPETISALQSKMPFYAIGPIFPAEFTKTSVSTSLWSESDCTHWLNTRPHGSVLYVSFGSYAHLNKNDLIEIANGLLLSNVSFVWVLRADIVSSDDALFGF